MGVEFKLLFLSFFSNIFLTGANPGRILSTVASFDAMFLIDCRGRAEPNFGPGLRFCHGDLRDAEVAVILLLLHVV